MLSFLIAGLALLINAEGDCPSAEAVRAHLTSLSAGEASLSPSVKIAHAGDRLDLTFDWMGSSARRSVPRPTTCDAEAAVAATVIAAWQADRQAALSEVTLAPSPRRSLRLSIEVAFVNALAGVSYAPAAEAAVLMGPAGSRFGALVGLLGEATRELGVGDGRAAFGRSALRLGADVALLRGRVQLSLRGEGLLALLYVEGDGFAQNFTRFDVDVGLSAGARLGLRFGRVRPTFGLDALGWLRPEQAFALSGQADASIDLPRFEVLLSIGMIVEAR